jgi:PAS domain S-box-containing protein
MFRAIVETTPDTIVIADEQHRIIFCNDKIKESFGYEPGELIGQELDLLVPPAYREQHRQGMQRFLDTRQPRLMGKTLELMGLRKAGTEFPMELSLSFWEESGKLYFSAIIRDITQRKNTEKSLLRERQHLLTILETVEDGILACDEDGNLTFFNRAARKLLGEKVFEDFQNFEHRIRNFNFYYPGGRKLDRLEDLPLYRVLHGEEFSAEEMEIQVPGKEKVVILLSGRRIRTEAGEHLGGVSIFQNITTIRHKEVELKKKNQVILKALKELKLAEYSLLKTNSQLEMRVAERTSQLQESNRELNQKNEELEKINADLDNFVYIASHDLKTPLLNLEALLTLMKYELPADFLDREKELLARLESSVLEMKQTIQDIGGVARVQRPQPMPAEKIALAPLFQEISASIDHWIQEAGARIAGDFSPAPAIHFAPGHLKSILGNLISNAIKYSSPERKPVIEVSSYRQSPYLVLQVRDNGLGIDLARNGSKLFNMFTRLHNHVEGSGIGLYIVKRIVENHRGRIEVDSQLGEGTTFKVYLPQAPEKENAG